MSLIKSNHGGLGGSGAPGGALGSFYSHTIDQSLKIDDSSGGYLTISSASPTATNRKKVTISCWVKRAGSGSGVNTVFWADAQGLMLQFFADNRIYIYEGASSFQAYAGEGAVQVFRDFSAWYHLVLIIDTTQSTAANRAKFYVNGTQLDLNSHPGQDTLMNWHTGSTMRIGSVSDTDDLAGYIAEFISIDGQDTSISDFGETQDGVWVPKNVSGLTLGNAGFYLKFDNSSDIGNDSGSNNIDFTGTNLAATDVVLDSPTNNFATLNPLVVSGGVPTLSEGNLKLVGSGSDYDTSYATIAVTSGKWYAEFLYVSGDDRGMFGVVREDRLYYVNGSNYIGSIDDTYGIDFRARVYTGTSATSSSGSQLFDATNFDTGDIGLLCFDIDNGKLWFGRRDVSGSTTIWYDSSGNNNGDPSAGSNPTYTFTATGSTWFIGCHDYAGTTLIANFGQDGSFAGSLTSQGASDAGGIGDFNYIESGFLALCSSNMPDITIGPGQSRQSDDYFNTVLYTGDGASSNAITGVGFQPDWVWIKSRSAATIHNLFDSPRGTKLLQAQATDGEQDNANYLTAYGADGFTVGSSGNVNASSATFVAWNWLAGGTPTADNSAGNGATPTAGSVKIDGSNLGSALAGSLAAKKLTANTDAGFSVVAWDASGVSSGTVAHGLTAAPDIIIAKPSDKDGTNWFVQVPDVLANTHMLNLETSGAAYNPGYNHFNDTVPTSTVFSFGGYLGGHSDLGSDTEKIAYCFHSVEGYSKVGSYTGNFNANGPFIYTGFRPAWLIIKRTDGADSWLMRDNKRDPDNVTAQMLNINSSGQEYTDSTLIDFLSNGFKLRHQNSLMNANGGTFIYLCFAEAPLKFANAR